MEARRLENEDEHGLKVYVAQGNDFLPGFSALSTDVTVYRQVLVELGAD